MNVRKTTLKLLTDSGANVIRVQIYARTKEELKRDLKKANEIAAFVKKNKRVKAILSIVKIGKLLGGACSDEHKESFWKSENCTDEALNLLDRVFDNSSDFDGFEIFSEPFVKVNGTVKRPPKYLSFMEKIALTLQKKKRMLLLNPGPGGFGRFEDFKPLEEKNIVYVTHFYQPHAFTHQGIGDLKLKATYPSFILGKLWDLSTIEKKLKTAAEFSKRYKVPVVVSEFSAVAWADGRDAYINDVISACEKLKLGWIYFGTSGYVGWDVFYHKIPVYLDLCKNPVVLEKVVRMGKLSPTWQIVKKHFKKQQPLPRPN